MIGLGAKDRWWETMVSLNSWKSPRLERSSKTSPVIWSWWSKSISEKEDRVKVGICSEIWSWRNVSKVVKGRKIIVLEKGKRN